MDLSYLSINQQTTKIWSVREAAEGCARHNIPWIGLERVRVAKTGIKETKRIVNDLGLKISGLNWSRILPAQNETDRAAGFEDNLRAIDEAAELGCDMLVVTGGPRIDCDLNTSRALAEEIIYDLIPYATKAKVKLAIEPLNPIHTASRSVLVSLGQANKIVERAKSPYLGVLIDTYHVWWDPDLYDEINKSAGNIFGFHVNDWLVVTDPLASRGMMGDGFIEIKAIRKAVQDAGYNGPVDVEIFNHEMWETPYDEVLELIKERFVSCV